MRKQTTKKGKGRKVPIEPPINAPHVQRQFNFGPEFALSEEDEALAASDDPKHREAIRLRWLNKEKVTMKMIEVALYDCSDPKFETMVGDLNPEEPKHVNLFWAIVWIFELCPNKIHFPFVWACEEANQDAEVIRRGVAKVRRQAMILVLRTLAKLVNYKFAQKKQQQLLEYVDLSDWQLH
ncbi:hypothetical protein ACIPLR_24895 [Herbaspirillum huttiense]|uniref:hypothetical protein n=1 Tax=Herbaspirillum TaxID=963 RepID=UPI000980C209|nr:hypothetical protein [Herbaspirillum sp. VT-16-41]ONN63805.1 hypothetical protein BTM36_25555 [Herbaspirillum sp. VT-16-41]